MPDTTTNTVTSDEIKSLIDRLATARGKTKAFDRQIDTARTRLAAVWKTLRRIEVDGDGEKLLG